MSGKTTKQHLFEVQLNWLTDTKGILSARDANGTIHVATPPAFGGSGKPWSPEHLLLGAVSSCFMTTFVAFSRKLRFEPSRIECDIIGQVEMVEGSFKFTNINVYPRVTVVDLAMKEKASIAVEKTHKYCLISNSLNARTIYHTEIIVDEAKLPFKNAAIHSASSEVPG